MYDDRDIGFTQEQHSSCLTEIQQDDDVDTDEEVYEHALKACSRDFSEARHKLDSYRTDQFINNTGIRERVRQPEMFDRHGKFNAFEREDPQIHPSLTLLGMEKHALSQAQSFIKKNTD